MSEIKLQQESNENLRVTWEGCNVLLDINNGDRLLFARLNPGATVKIEKTTCSLRPLVGCPFGSMFQIENGSDGPYLSRVVPSEQGNDNQENGVFESKSESRDNRALVDNNTAQTLTGEDINELRRQGATGNEIVEALITNSATFDKKTSFSQEKYRLKKQKKYAPRIILRRPVARSICDTYFKKNPAKIGCLRIDTLSLLLSMANVTSNSDILVVDMLGGIITGAVAERLGGSGYVCNTYMGSKQSTVDIVKMFNFNDEICRRIVCSSLTDLLIPAEIKKCELIFQQDVTIMKSQSNEQIPTIAVSLEETPVSSENGMENLVPDTTTVSPINKTLKSAKAGEKPSQEVIKMWRDNGFSSLIIASLEQDAWSIVKEVLPLLSYSASFAIYHQYLQPLATCMHNLQLEKMAINLQITEPWLREYQVLPSRTHPCMQMSAFGGYILSGTRICFDNINTEENKTT